MTQMCCANYQAVFESFAGDVIVQRCAFMALTKLSRSHYNTKCLVALAPGAYYSGVALATEVRSNGKATNYVGNTLSFQFYFYSAGNY